MESPSFSTAQEVSLAVLLPMKSRGLNGLGLEVSLSRGRH